MGQDLSKCCFGAEDNNQPKPGYISLATYKVDGSPALKEKDKQYMMEEDRWFEKQGKLLSEPEKLFNAFPNYVKVQRQIEKYWKEINLEPKLGENINRVKTEVIKFEWKYLLRKGAQMKDVRDIILNIFCRKYENNDVEYTTQLKIAFDHVPETFKNVPLFTHEESLDDVIKVHFLNEQGLIALKRILWVFRKSFPKLEYCPMLAPVLSILLLFLSESEAYCVTRFLLEESTKLLDERSQYLAEDMRAMRWHFTLGKEDFEKFISSFFEKIQTLSKGFSKLIKHFEKIGFDYHAMFEELFRHLFLGYVPLPLALQMFLAFLNEGIKIYYRMGYALFSILRDKLLPINNPEELRKALLQFALNLDEKQRTKIVKKAYGLRLTNLSTEFSKVDINPGSVHEAKVYYRPLVSEASSVIKEEIFEVLWQWLPKTSKLHDPLLLYSTYRDGFSLRSMYKKCEEYAGYPMLIIIKSDHNTIFGAYIDDSFRITSGENRYIGSNECFVFMLYPEEVAFFSTEKNRNHLLATSEYFSIGSGGDGNAIYLDQELLNGSSYRSETYDNIQLNGKTDKLEANFKCMGLELYLSANQHHRKRDHEDCLDIISSVLQFKNLL